MSNFFKATPKSYKLLGYCSGFFCLIFYVIGLFFEEKANPYLFISFVLAVIYGYCLWQVDEKEELLSDYAKNLREHKKFLKKQETGKNEIEGKVMSNFSQKVPSKHELKAMRKRDEKGRYISN